jgi:hypothetical protein
MSIIDTIKGVFSGDDSNDKIKDQSPNTPEQQKMYDVVWTDYQFFKEKRQEIEDTWRQEDRFYEGGKKHWEGLRTEDTMKARPNSVDNVAWSQIESIVAGLTGWSPEAEFEGREPDDDQKAADITAYMPYEMEQINFDEKYLKAVRRLAVHGLWVTKTVHDPTITGGYGDKRFIGRNDFIPLDYGSFFPDPRIVDFLYIQQSKALIIHTIKELEYFKERFKDQGPKVQMDNLASDVEIFDTNRNDSTTYKSQRSGLIEYWYKGKPKILTKEDKKLFKEMAQEKLAEGKDPSLCEARAAGTVEGIHCIYISTSGVFLEHIPYVYDHGEYPVQVKALFPIEGSLWPKGYMRDLISPQIMLNKFSELAVEQTAKVGNEAMMYEEGAINDSQKTIWKRIRSQVAAMLPVTQIDKVKELPGTPPHPIILSFMQHYLDMLQKIPRRFDSANGASNAQVTSGEQAKALQSASQGHLSVPSKLIQAALKESFRQQIALMAQFYTTERMGRITGKQVGISAEKIKGLAPTTYDQQAEDGTTQSVDVQEEYVPDFDIRIKIGVEKPNDREYWVQTAWMAFDKQIIDAKAVTYTIENGRMEPFSVIEERLGKDQQIAQQMQQLQQENQMVKAENDALYQHAGELQQNSMSDTAKTMEHLNNATQQEFDQQTKAADMAHRQQMDKHKMAINAAKVAQMGQRQPVGGGSM